MHVRRGPFGCCRGGSARAFTGFGETNDLGQDLGQGLSVPEITAVSTVPPEPSGSFPFVKLLLTSVAAGLVLHALTKKG